MATDLVNWKTYMILQPYRSAVWNQAHWHEVKKQEVSFRSSQPRTGILEGSWIPNIDHVSSNVWKLLLNLLSFFISLYQVFVGACGIQSPDQASIPGPLALGAGVLATAPAGPPRKPLPNQSRTPRSSSVFRAQRCAVLVTQHWSHPLESRLLCLDSLPR